MPRCRSATLLSLVPLLLACEPPGERGTEAAASVAQPEVTSFRSGSGAAEALIPVYVALAGPPAAEAVRASGDPTAPGAAARVRARLARLAEQHDRLRPQLAAFGVIDAELSRLANAFQLRVPEAAIAELLRLPEVALVEPVPLLEPSLLSAVPLIGGPQVWASPTLLQGDGIRIGIIDSGIDYLHADFGGSGDPADFAANDPAVIEPGTFPTARVIGGWDFVGAAYNPSDEATTNDDPQPDPDPLDCFEQQSMNISGGHGTHVAGIAAGGGVLADGTPFAGPYEQSLDPSAFLIGPGVAPRAALYALKIFGCNGGTLELASALERAADPNEDGDLSDRLDIVNASLGGAFGLESQVNAQLIANLTALGSLLVAAAGNDGSTFYVTGSPGSQPATLSVAASASTDYVGLVVASPPAVAGVYPATESTFTVKLAQTGNLSGALVMVEPHDACSPLQNAAQLSGQVALIDRGTCYFQTKLERVEAAGAIAGVVIDNEYSDAPLVMDGDGSGDNVPIPGLLIRLVHGEALEAQTAPIMVTLDATTDYEELRSETLAGFSSRGPATRENRLKPDVAAPGTAIDSAQVGSGIHPRRSQGTSMASPLVAGAAALVRQARPTWTAQQIKAVLMNTAVAVSNAADVLYPVSLTGAGRIDLPRAVAQQVTASTDAGDGSVGVTFGALIGAEPMSLSRGLVVENHGDEPVSYDVTAALTHPLAGVTVSVEPPALTVGAGQSEPLTVVLDVDPAELGAPEIDPVTDPMQWDYTRYYLNEAAGHVVLTDLGGAQSLHLPFHGIVRAAARRAATVPLGCATGTATERIVVPLAGPSAHPEPVVSAFQLGATHPEKPASSADPLTAMSDIIAVGAASSAAVDDFENISLDFAVAVAGPWTTVAQGALSVVGIMLDIDRDASPDYVIFAEALTGEGPYADVLASTTYNLKVYQQPIRRFLNLVSRADADTQPFNNSVIVLGTKLSELGIDKNAENTSLYYRAFSYSPKTLTTADYTEWAKLDPLRPVLDTVREADFAGHPLFAGDEVVVHVDRGAAGGAELPELMLLHHTNVAGERLELIALDEVTAEARLEVIPQPIRPVAPEGSFILELTVTNPAAVTLRDTALEATLGEAAPAFAWSTAGDCSLAAPEPAPEAAQVVCALGDLAAGQTVDVRIQATAAGRSTLDLAVVTTSAGGCTQTTSATVDVDLAAPEPPAALEAAGGCGCRALGSAGRADGGLLLLGLLGLAAGRRRSRA